MTIDRQRRRELRGRYGPVSDLQHRRRVLGIVGTLALLIGAAILIPASAGATAVFNGGTGEMKSLTGQHDGGEVSVSGGLLSLTIGSSDAVAYCTDFRTSIQSGATLEETGWDDTAALSDGRPIAPPQLRTVYWLLRNSYPTASLTDVKAASGIAGLDGAEAAAATQAAIWNVTDGFVLTAADADVLSLYAWLLANQQELNEEPAPSLVLTPPATTEVALGQAVGPYVVSTTATDDASGSVGIAVVGGVAYADAALTQPLAAVNSGGQFWIGANSAGPVQIEATVASVVGAGRYFLGTNPGGSPAQRLVLAADELVGVQSSATASFLEAQVTTTVPQTTTAPTTTAVSTTAPATTAPTTTSTPTVNLADTVTISQTCVDGKPQLLVSVNDEFVDVVYTGDIGGVDMGTPTRRESFYEWTVDVDDMVGQTVYVTVVHPDGRDATFEVVVTTCNEGSTRTTPSEQTTLPATTVVPATTPPNGSTTPATTPPNGSTTTSAVVIVSTPAPTGLSNPSAADLRSAVSGNVAVQGKTLARTGGRGTDQIIFGGMFLLFGLAMVGLEMRARRRSPF